MPYRSGVGTASLTPRRAWATGRVVLGHRGFRSPRTADIVGNEAGRERKTSGFARGDGPAPLRMLATHDESRMNLRSRERWPSLTDPVPAGRDTSSSEQPGERWPVGASRTRGEKANSRKFAKDRST